MENARKNRWDPPDHIPTVRDPIRKIPFPAALKSLPIYHRRAEILASVRGTAVTLISAPTGSGKSVVVPLLLDNDALLNGQRCNILVAMPRRIAVVNLCDYVCRTTNYQPGDEVGYQIGMDKPKVSKRTRILYCTVGILLEKLTHGHPSGHPFSVCTHIILDEVHERTEDIDFFMMIYKRSMHKSAPLPKLVIMSATMDATQIQKYFTSDHFKVPPLISVAATPMHAVEEVYLDQMIAELGNSMRKPVFDIEKACVHYELMKLILDHISMMHDRTPEDAPGTTTVIFLPGLGDIETMMDMICRDYGDKLQGKKKWEICPLHSQIPQHMQDAVLLPVNHSVWRIVIASGIAESSITVPKVDKVYDLCLTKTLVADSGTQIPSLQLQWATISSCDQRKGRTGRVLDGTVYRLVDKDFFDRLQTHPRPEVLSGHVKNSILRSKILKIPQGPVELLQQMISPPAMDDVLRAVQLLKEKGALNLYHDGQLLEYDGDLTFLGYLCAILPLSVPLCRLIFLTFSFDMIDDGIVLACIISAERIFETSWMTDTDEWIIKKQYDRGMRSDCLASFNIFRDWSFRLVNGQFGAGNNTETERNWCRQHCLSQSRLVDVLEVVRQIQGRLAKLGMYTGSKEYFGTKFEPTQEWQVLIKMAVAGAFYPDYMLHSPPADHGTLKSIANSNNEELTKFGGFDPMQCVNIVVPTRPDTVGSVFYERMLRDYIGNILGTEVFPSIAYLQNKAVVCLEPGVFDVAGQGSLHVEQLLRYTKKRQSRYRTGALALRAVTQGCVTAFTRAHPDVVEKAKTPNCWISLDYIRLQPEFPQPTVLASQITGSERYAIVSAKWDPDVFFARLFLAGPDPLDQLTKELQVLVETDLVQNCLPADKKEQLLGNYVITYLDDQSNEIARAKVVQIDKDTVDVYLVDYGQRVRLPWEWTRVVMQSDATRCFWEYPMLAVKCRLAESFSVPPLHNMSVFDRIQQANGRIIVKVSHSKNGVVILHKIDVLAPSGRECLSVRMVDEQLVKFDTEFAAKVRVPHATKTMIPAETVDPKYIDMSNISFAQPVNSYDIGPDGYGFLYKVSRGVKAKPESVNAVLLRTSVPDPIDHVLVSCQTSVSKGQNRVICADTTLMPRLPGMAVLLGMMYAPVVEMSFDPETSQISSVLCGLGAMSSGTQAAPLALFAAHDCTIFADGIIDQADVASVRDIRKTVNTILKWTPKLKMRDGKTDVRVEGDIKGYQKHLRQVILQLLHKNRDGYLIPHTERLASVRPRHWRLPMGNQLPAGNEVRADRITHDLR